MMNKLDAKKGIERNEVFQVLDKYEKDNLTIGVLGSHSALEIAYGAKKEGFNTLVVCQKGREATYTKHYNNLFDHHIILEQFKDMVDERIQEKLRNHSTIWIPHRSFSVYVGYSRIENKFKIPIFGNRYMFKTEERNFEKNQYYLLDRARIQRPQTIEPEEIDGPAIIKMHEADREVERAFFYASSYEEYKEKAKKRIEKGIIDEKDLKEATVEELGLGALFNANCFWSPLNDEIDLLGFDRRIQTDLDGVQRLPAKDQLELDLTPQNIAIGHTPATMRESKIEKVFEAGRKFVETCKEEYPPGIIGPFALQGVITKELEFMVFDVSPRVPGAPIVPFTSPYTAYKYGEQIGQGRRVAMEIKHAQKQRKLKKVVT